MSYIEKNGTIIVLCYRIFNDIHGMVQGYRSNCSELRGTAEYSAYCGGNQARNVHRTPFPFAQLGMAQQPFQQGLPRTREVRRVGFVSAGRCAHFGACTVLIY